MTIKADTNSLLDLCTCGARAGWVTDFAGVAVQCLECAEGTPLMRDKAEAMVAWNKMMRKRKGLIK